MADSKFVYAPIDLETDAIRLVRLIRGSDGDLIVCDLFETFLHHMDGTPYEALSYTWGGASVLVEITLCGKKAMISDNLHTALCALREHDRDRLMWIDAICIDQESHLEKGHQVGQMRLIYQNAHNVHIWLGESSPDTDLLLGIMQRLDKRAIRRPEYRRNSTSAWFNEWRIMLGELKYLAGIPQHPNEFRQFLRRILKDLLGRPWFRRVWVIQEVFSAKVATAGCGRISIPTRTFVLMPRLFELESDVDPYAQAVLEIMPGYLREHSWRADSPTLYTLLKRFVHSNATDARDKIYALLGISSDSGSNGFPDPDYDKTVTMEDVIRRTITYILFGGQSTTCPLPCWTLEQVVEHELEQVPGRVLEWALSENNEETAMRVLAGAGVYLNGSTRGDLVVQTPLLLLLQRTAWFDTVKYLLEDDRVDVNTTQHHSPSITPLRNAVNIQKTTMLEILLTREDIDLNSTNCMALQAAIYYENRAMLNMIVSNWDIAIRCMEEMESREGASGRSKLDSLLLGASESGHETAATTWLLRAKPLRHRQPARLSERLSEQLGRSFAVAAAKMHKSVVGAFLSDIVKSPDRLGILDRYSAVLHAAATGPEGKRAEIVSMLLSAGMPVEKKDGSGRSALWMSSLVGNTSVVEAMLEMGATVHTYNNRGQSALWISCEMGHIDTVRLLLEKGARVDDYDEYYYCTPTFIAAFYQRRRLVKLLVGEGADTGGSAYQGEVLDDDVVQETLDFISLVGHGSAAAHVTGLAS